MVNNLLLVSLENSVYTGTINHLCVGQVMSHAKCESSFWSKNPVLVPIYVFRIVCGLIGCGCRLAVLAHGFDVGHFWAKSAKTRVTKN